MKCLIIDDEAFNREVAVTLLSDLAECEEADCGTEAIAKFTAALESNAPYDLLLLDIMMPGMNGHETARAIRTIEKERATDISKRVKLVMLTALNSPQDAMDSFCSAQSSAYIIKPVSKEKILNVISTLGLLKKK